MAVLQWGSRGPEVERLQQRLKDEGYFFAPVDGVFGALTYAAVRRFQQAKGLTVDGIAGPDTLAALGLTTAPAGPGPGTSATPPATTGRRAMSLHVGINRVDPGSYGGWDGALSGCEQDARTMTDIARAEGFTPKQLFSPNATSENILQEIRRAAQALTTGDVFLITYAGHGGQAPDPTGTEETDKQDETWVAYNRQIIDDELELAFSEFRSGVDIVMISDSCHSGTVNRIAPGTRDADGLLQRGYAELKSSYYQDLAVSRPGPGDPPFAGFPRPARAAARQMPGSGDAQPELVVVGTRAEAMVDDNGRPAPVFAPEPPSGARSVAASSVGTFATRNIPLGVNEQANEIQHDDLVRAKNRARARGVVKARGVLLSGCADNQLSQEVGGAGVFTTALSRVWAANQFRGTYQELMNQVLTQMGPTQTPQLSGFGAEPERLIRKTPFDVV